MNLRGKTKNVPAHRKKNEKNSPRKLGIFFVLWEREEEKRNLHTREKKNVGVLLSFCSPVALEMARFCAEANNGGIKENILRKQRILRKRRSRKEMKVRMN